MTRHAKEYSFVLALKIWLHPYFQANNVILQPLIL